MVYSTNVAPFIFSYDTSAPSSLLYASTDLQKNAVASNESYKIGMLAEHIEDMTTRESSEDLLTQPSEESLEPLSAVPSREEGVAEETRPSTPPLVTNLMEMGFNRPQINVALERCDLL